MCVCVVRPFLHTQLASLAQGVTKWMRTHIAFMSSIKRLIHSQSRVQLDTEKLYPLERDIQTLQMRCVGRSSSSSSSSSVLHLCTALTLVVAAPVTTPQVSAPKRGHPTGRVQRVGMCRLYKRPLPALACLHSR